MSVLVTGGAGFIGSHLTRALVDIGANVMVMDNFSHGSMDTLKWAGAAGSELCRVTFGMPKIARGR